MTDMQGFFHCCLIGSILLSGAWAFPHDHEDPHHHHLHHEKEQAHPHHHDEEKSFLKLSSPNADFAFALYKRLSAQDGTKNVFFSPLGITSTMSMLAMGAKGATLEQLYQTLGYSNFTSAELNEAYEHLHHMLGHSRDALQLDTGSAVVLQENFKPQHKFQEDAKHYFQAEDLTVDFKKPEEAAQKINQLIAKRTHDKITDLVKDLDQDTVMMLLNYIFFRGKWVKPFEAKHTHKADFSVDETTKVSVEMMKRTGRFDYHYDYEKQVAVALLPYQGNASMMIVLPGEGKMKEVEEFIDKDHIKKWHDALVRSSLDIYLPKFSAAATYSLKKILQEMGVVEVFTDTADLSGISEEVGLKVSKVTHKAVLSVDEKGTEAAAVTTVEIMPMSMPVMMAMDRPFLLLILEESTKSILFMGKIVDPTAK